jgi:hypothetical protein
VVEGEVMPIKPNNLFATPGDMDSLMAWCDAHTGSEKAVAFTAAGMAINLCAQILKNDQDLIDQVNQEIADAEVEALGEFIHRVGVDIDNGMEVKEHG